jgi:outer membrane lipoprotein-sorting protein
MRPALIVVLSALSYVASAATLPQVFSAMDAQAAKFQGVQANFKRTTYTKVIDQTDNESGTLVMKRGKNRQIQAVMNVVAPDQKAVSFQGSKLEFFYPKLLEVHEVNLGKRANLVDQFLLLGFGASGSELQKSYDVKFLGEESINGHPAEKLELTPKSPEVKQRLTKVELWMDPGGGYPLQQKFYLPSGDTTLMTFSDVKMNPDLPDRAATLNLPKGVKRIKE